MPLQDVQDLHAEQLIVKSITRSSRPAEAGPGLHGAALMMQECPCYITGKVSGDDAVL